MRDPEFNKQLKQGNPESFSLLYQELRPRMLGYCPLFLKDGNQVEDLIQDCFVYLWDNKNKIKTDKSIENYLFVILRNKCLKVLKDRQLFYSEIPIEELPVNELQYLYQLDFTDKREISIEERLYESLKNAIEELPPKQKTAFIKNKIEGKKQKDIAQEMGVSVKVIEKHISLAKKRLQQKLQKEYDLYAIALAWVYFYIQHFGK